LDAGGSDSQLIFFHGLMIDIFTGVLFSGGKLEVLENGRILKLTFIKIHGDAGGNYECRGTAQDGSVQRKSVKLKLRGV
jgi:hypothetical protein